MARATLTRGRNHAIAEASSVGLQTAKQKSPGTMRIVDSDAIGATTRRRASPERSLAALYPALAAELHLTRNGDLDPFALGVSTRQEVWWSCPDCGHEWRTRVRARTAGSGCPRCARARVGAILRARAAASQ